MQTNMRMASGKSLRRSGVTLIEAVAGLVLGLPLVVLIIFVATEVCMYFLIQSNLDAATRKASRDFSTGWGKDPSVASVVAKQNAIYADCLIPGYVNNIAQFSAPIFDGNDPPSVTVVTTYTSGQYGLSPFPHPNPLKLGADFVIRSEATYRLE